MSIGLSLAERVADEFTQQLDMKHISSTQSLILHAIKSVAVKQWAQQQLIEMRGY